MNPDTWAAQIKSVVKHIILLMRELQWYNAMDADHVFNLPQNICNEWNAWHIQLQYMIYFLTKINAPFINNLASNLEEGDGGHQLTDSVRWPTFCTQEGPDMGHKGVDVLT